jgi:hypothetical protein
MNTYEMPRLVCPSCGKTSTHATDARLGQTEPPQDGDFTVCIECLAYLTFEKGGLVLLSKEAFEQLDEEARTTLVQARRHLREVEAQILMNARWRPLKGLS